MPAALNMQGELVDRVVLELNMIGRRATFDFTMSVGEVIIRSFYSGDLHSWRARGTKNASFRKLAAHPQLPMSSGALYRSVAIYEMCVRLGVRQWRHLCTSHLRLVLGIPHDEQLRLLKVAEAERWPVSRLEREVMLLKSILPDLNRRAGGRKRWSRLLRIRRKLDQCVDAVNGLMGIDEASSDSTSPESARRVIDAVARVKHACSVFEDRVSQYLENRTEPHGLPTTSMIHDQDERPDRRSDRSPSA